MKKKLILVTILVIGLIGLSLASLFAVMQTRYAPQAMSYLFKWFTTYQITAQHAKYTTPLQLTLENAVIKHHQQQIEIPTLTLWLSPSLWHQGKLALDSLLIEGATLDLSHNDASIFDDIDLQQLALKQVNLSANHWSAKKVSLQIEKPQWHSKEQILPYGDIQLSAQQLYVRGETLTDVLVDADYQPQDSTIYGTSFKWHNGQISGQAEQYQQGWSLVNVTASNLDLDGIAPAKQLLGTLQFLHLPVYHINSLDILHSNLNYRGWHFEQLDASFENLSLNQSFWQQEDGYLSFNAEKLSYQQFEFISPTAQLGFNQNGISVELFNADFKEGWLQFNGELSPTSVDLKELKLSNIKWLEGLSHVKNSLQSLIVPLQNLTVEDFEINNSQFIQVERHPYWQLSGFNLEGEQLELINQKQIGLFNGELEISANNASVDKLFATQLIIKMQAEQGKLNLNRAFFPLRAGYIEANGQWDRSTLSAPWNLVVHADGVPTDLPFIESQLPFNLQGMAEFEVELSGLSGDYAMFSHSLSGKAQMELHDTQLDAKSSDGEISFEQNWPLDKITINADRGRLNVASKSDQAELSGHIDMTKPNFATLLFVSQTSCQRLWSELFSLTNMIEPLCSEQKIAPPAETADKNNQEAIEVESSLSNTL